MLSWAFAHAAMCELVALLIVARVLFALLVARCLQCDGVHGMHAVYRFPFSYHRVAASVASLILFALLEKLETT